MIATHLSRRLLLAGVAAAAGLASGILPAGAVEPRAPTGPIEVTVGTSAGGTPDVMMRRMAQVLQQTGIVKEPPIVVVNRTGGSWMVASNYVLGKAGDENTYLAIAQPMLTTPITQGLPNTFEKLTPLALFVQADLVVAVRPEFEAKSFKELVEIAKKKPRSVRQAGAQVGSTDYMVTGLIQKAGGVEINYIPFDGGGSAQTAFLGGNVDMIVLTIDEALPLQKAGKARILGVLNEKRRTDAELKDIPTAREQGFDVVWGQAWGLMGAANLDPAVVAWWDDKLGKMVQTPEWKKMIADNYLRSEYTDSAQTKVLLKKIYEDHLALLRTLGLSKQ
ncbi:tripartite tricarboxylate transporter substrate binding protein [Starkeya koreensis]|uniref:Tripartite tricarboxylate transporter substrate binding protein n=1 Tax=Ancylobacter koreensis TaxID=266121 RepID=A0ABT0DR26_9HYPH|nr:tripartite tricarboxylate transporter substrate binding protein [Ancylobacter koreensis]MCK0209715.1 tripartite tricarboxylate transporter substrate binding protein [Ancylobacter koreensis]